MQIRTAVVVMLAAMLSGGQLRSAEPDVLPPIAERFQSPEIDEVPSFQRHVVPLFGRLGCNGRACHGSFQGRGGFQLSLFGYDFQADHAALLDKDSPRVDPADPAESLILIKPTDADMHEGGLRYEKDGWQYRVLRNWIDAGAKYDAEKDLTLLERLDVTPTSIDFTDKNQSSQLQVIAVWKDGSREDVTPLCRFQSNDEQVAAISTDGVVTSNEPGDTHVVVFYDNGVVPIPVVRPTSNLIGDKYPQVPTPTKVDELVVEKLRKLGIVPSDLSSDEEFLRRVSLDLTGTLPAPAEIEAFVNDQSTDKRARKIDQLLESPAYAAWWTTKLCDFTGNNDFQLNNFFPTRGGTEEWYEWIYQRVAQNVPYDELAEGIVTATSREGDESYLDFCAEMSEICRGDSDKTFADRESMPLYWARRDFRDNDARAIGFAYTFMGIRIQCAQCHKHPFDQWSKQDFEQFAALFGGVVANARVRPADRKAYDQILEDLGLKGERVNNQVRRQLSDKLKEGKTVPFPEVYVQQTAANRRGGNNNANGRTAKLLGGDEIDLTEHPDPRVPLMQWLRAPDNRFFAKAFVNRVWANYFNVGLVNPPDDLSLANPPSNQAVLDYLTKGFVDSGFDMKWLHREITNSRTYQLSWRTNETNVADEKNFSHMVPRRLPAEVAYDILNQATASTADNAEARQDLQGRAIRIPGSSSRDASRGNGPSFALSVFGRSIRESNCDCDRSSEASLLQTVFLQNDRDVLAMIERRGGWVDEIVRAAKPGNAAQQNSLPGDYKQRVAQMKRRIAQLQKQGDDDQAQKLEVTLNRYMQRFSAGEAKTEPAPLPANVDPQQLVNQAYLRTLSRYPTPQESQRSLQFLQESPELAGGLQGLVWALINTKEFIVNH